MQSGIMNNKIPKLHSKEYRVIFYHHKSKGILKYKFNNYETAVDFYNKLDIVKSQPTMYVIERIK